LRLVFADEFNTATLDRTKWNVEGPDFWVNNEVQAYVDSAETISFTAPAGADGGALTLRPVYKPRFITPSGRSTDFVSGRINTSQKFDLTYGKVEARIRMPDATGVWPAFWMLGYGNWPDCGEIDIMENVGEKGWTNAAIHGPGYSGNTPLVQRQNFPAGQDVTGWHIYTVERGVDTIIFSVDGREFYRVTRTMVQAYGAWRFDRQQYLILNFALGGVYPNAVNAVTTPYFGMPQTTADRIARGEVAMDVDWVRAWEAI
jgi:beta-glucanase (GH16 family)